MGNPIDVGEEALKQYRAKYSPSFLWAETYQRELVETVLHALLSDGWKLTWRNEELLGHQLILEEHRFCNPEARSSRLRCSTMNICNLCDDNAYFSDIADHLRSQHHYIPHSRLPKGKYVVIEEGNEYVIYSDDDTSFT